MKIKVLLNVILEVNVAFWQAAHDILLENESLLQRFTLELKTSHDSGSVRCRCDDFYWLLIGKCSVVNTSQCMSFIVLLR